MSAVRPPILCLVWQSPSFHAKGFPSRPTNDSTLTSPTRHSIADLSDMQPVRWIQDPLAPLVSDPLSRLSNTSGGRRSGGPITSFSIVLREGHSLREHFAWIGLNFPRLAQQLSTQRPRPDLTYTPQAAETVVADPLPVVTSQRYVIMGGYAVLTTVNDLIRRDPSVRRVVRFQIGRGRRGGGS
ncbi:MAG: hypothetical protein Q9160_008184 [Pyrenula sp. 1 TL-2023]